MDQNENSREYFVFNVFSESIWFYSKFSKEKSERINENIDRDV